MLTSIMLEKYRVRAQEFLKYMRDVRMAASRSPGWFRYDEQYRLRKQANHQSSWGIINPELWLLHVTNDAYPSHNSGKAPAAAPPNMSRVQTAKNYSKAKANVNSSTFDCHYFNAGKTCKFISHYRYSHKYHTCGGAAKCRSAQ